MKIQVNSDKTIAVDASLTKFVEGEVKRVLGRFAGRLTRVEIHLNDVDNKKSGQADKRCLVEARPAGDRPLSASAKTTHVATAVAGALGKMQRSLTTFFGKKGKSAVAEVAPIAPVSKAAPKKKAVKKAAAKKVAAKKAAAKKQPAKKAAPVESPAEAAHDPKKKPIYQARRKSWPTR